MIARILTPRESSKGVLAYNEEKVCEGLADVVRVENIESDNMFDIFYTFMERESLPSIDKHTKTKSFHMTLGPDADEHLSEDQIIQLINLLMMELGYQEQPYVIYKHRDIEREHYHIVSTRIQSNGKTISRENDAKKLMGALRRYENRFHYVTGKSGNRELTLISNLKKYNTKLGSSYSAFYTLAKRAEQFDCKSMTQVRLALRSMGIHMKTVPNRRGTSNIILQGIDNKGKTAFRPVSAERQMKINLYDEFVQCCENNKHAPRTVERDGDKYMIQKISEVCIGLSTNIHEYFNYMRQFGYSVEIAKGKGGGIESVSIADPRSMTILDSRFDLVITTSQFSSLSLQKRNVPMKKLTREYMTKVWDRAALAKSQFIERYADDKRYGGNGGQRTTGLSRGK